MNKLIRNVAISALCLSQTALSSGMGGSNDRELGSNLITSPIPLGNLNNLGNIGTLMGELINGFGNNNTNPLPIQIVHFNTTTPVVNTTTPVVNTTTPVVNPTPVANTTTPVVNPTPVANTTTPVVNPTPVANTTTPVVNPTPTTPVSNTTTTPAAPVNNNWYARNDVDMSAFANKCLVIHNILRGAVGVAPLTWSDSLAASAQAWAENMAVNGFRHSGRTGENIASTTSSSKTLLVLLDLWTREQDWFIKGCQYPHCSSTGAEVGHYTQMVWSTTTQVGCGFAPGVDKQWNYLCCQYYRAGNIIGYYVYPYTNPTTGVTTP